VTAARDPGEINKRFAAADEAGSSTGLRRASDPSNLRPD
jgi:hypothetical protein